jgi:hypothetical protein
VEAVIGEPVSTSYFPVPRENTGKFWRLCLWGRGATPISKQIQCIHSEFPGERNREFR